MKTKKFEKKLVLNRKTIADLSNGQLGNVKGGYTPNPAPTVFTGCTFCTCTEPCFESIYPDWPC